MKYQLVSVYARAAAYFLVPSVRDIRGLNVDSEPVARLQADAVTPAEIGRQVRFVIDQAMAQGSPAPNAVLTASAMPTWRKFMKGATVCLVQIFDDSIKLRPTFNDGRGFSPLAEEVPIILPVGVDDTALGEAVLSLLQKSV